VRLGPLGLRVLVTALAGLVAMSTPIEAATEQLSIGSPRGTIDFAIGDSKVFRTSGGFKSWQGKVQVDDVDVSKSSVEVTVATPSIAMLDAQQTTMLRDVEFFDVDRHPTMQFRSTRIERTGETTLRVLGEITLRGITRPMQLEVTVTERRPDAAPGKRYAYFRAEGSIKRSEFGMVKFIDLVGDTVDISIRTDAWR
jgi:polyisoprenoid-binding protein YceI